MKMKTLFFPCNFREEAEEVRASVLEILPDPWRPLPGRLDIASQGARLEAGLDCDEVTLSAFPGHILTLYFIFMLFFGSLA